jgi:hypothetical protein
VYSRRTIFFNFLAIADTFVERRFYPLRWLKNSPLDRYPLILQPGDVAPSEGRMLRQRALDDMDQAVVVQRRARDRAKSIAKRNL